MNEDRTALDRLQERLAALRFPPSGTVEDPFAGRLEALRGELPALPAEREDYDAPALLGLLAARSDHVERTWAPYLEACREELALLALREAHSFEVLFAFTRLVDAIHRTAFAVALEEFPLLLQVRRLEAEQEHTARAVSLPARREKLAALEAELARSEDPAGDPPDAEHPAQRAYLEHIAEAQRAELAAQERAATEAQAALPALAAMAADGANGAAQGERIAQRVVMFARGGYGRAEMSFSSDIDTGYGLDIAVLEPAQVGVFHELVLRMEHLLHAAGLHTAHQFFELGEDLSRFTEPETLHTIPSILESRPLAGNAALLGELQRQFRAVMPFERMVRQKIEEYDEQPAPGYTAMDLKEDFGGLRSIQSPLWLLGLTQEAQGYSTVELLELARERGLLSLWEVSRLALALELLYDLRNFLGGAERYYYDREARESGFHVQGFTPNRLDDHLARLYLFRTQRFASIDAFDTYRLRLVEEVQRISRRLLARVLDRTVSQTLGPFKVHVHLGQRRIIAVIPAPGGDAAADTSPRVLFRDAPALLTLFAYIASTGYELAPELIDALAETVTALTLPADAAALTRQAALLSEVVGGPFAHRALETLFEISDPLAPEMPSLMGRFIPAFDEAIFLLRRFEGQTVPLHTHLLRSLAAGEAELNALRRRYPELHALLQREDVLALKWALVLSALGRLPGNPPRPAHTAERAAEVLAALGYQDADLERRVRLLIEHHASVAALARTATYMDQALARYFEIAGRELVNVTLLYLVNLAVLQAQGAGTEVDVAGLRRLFGEANEMLGEMRGFPVQERSLELINLYFDRKKQELIADTRLHLLLQSAIARGLGPAVYEPLERGAQPPSERLLGARAELESLQRQIVLGARSPADQARLEERLMNALRNHLGREAILALTAEHDELLSWIFAGFANRFLMASLPGELAAELAKFSHFREAPVIVDVVSGPHGASDGLLIYIHGLSRPHTRVAYALSRNRVNIGSGKVNRVELGGGEHAFCYYFQISLVDPDARLDARDLELMIATEHPPELDFPKRTTRYERPGVRVDFEGHDAKGYRVVPREGRFERQTADFPHLRVVLRDEPYLFYKVSRAFDLFDVEVQQSLITTIGNQVVDYFYLDPEDYERLHSSTFEEVLINLVHSDLLAVAR